MKRKRNKEREERAETWGTDWNNSSLCRSQKATAVLMVFFHQKLQRKQMNYSKKVLYKLLMNVVARHARIPDIMTN